MHRYVTVFIRTPLLSIRDVDWFNLDRASGQIATGIIFGDVYRCHQSLRRPGTVSKRGRETTAGEAFAGLFASSPRLSATLLVGNGMGVIANYTYVKSAIDYIDPASPTGISTRDLVGLSRDAYNATVYYETDRFSIRGSASYRDQYLTTVPGRNNNDIEGTNETFNVDLAASYDVNDRLTITVEGLNLTDEDNNQYVDTLDRVFVFHHTGREYFVGARYALR
jgi:hypothetical protein